jgi:cation diffusion facilitator CzcD-associated flavoprotein CzcO
MPLLEEMGYMASKKYARQPEILEHARSIGQKLDLYSKTLFQTEVLDLDWINDSSCWSVRTSRGDTIRAQFVVSAIGLLHKLHVPGIQGIEIFKGYSFHSSRWDYDYTGGDFNGNLFKLSDKKVGIIGTGASCVQILPHLSTSAKHVYIFQRTPSAVDGQKNPSTDPNFAKGPASKPGWQTRRMANFDSIVSGSQEEKDMVADGWTEVYTKTPPFQPSKDTAEGAAIAKHMQLADFKKMEEIRARTDAIVKDPKTAGKKSPGGRKALGEGRPWGKKNHGIEPTMQADATAILVFSLSLSTFALSIHKPLLAREYR